MPRFSAIKPSQQSYLQPMEFRTTTVTDIGSDGMDTGTDSQAQESEC